ncbi:hypothetical protein BJ742DRAFT_873314 [Cladochytrium replicatum]|nr:hypothetical protein BJ742DRAFT_873314 [Cladochytrium replicatum]
MATTDDFSHANHKALNAVTRLKDRARYDADSVFEHVDSGLISHVGLQSEGSLTGSPEDEEDWPYLRSIFLSVFHETCVSEEHCEAVVHGAEESGEANHALVKKGGGHDRLGESGDATPAEIKSTRPVPVKIESATANGTTGSVDYGNVELNKKIWTGVIPLEEISEALKHLSLPHSATHVYLFATYLRPKLSLIVIGSAINVL